MVMPWIARLQFPEGEEFSLCNHVQTSPRDQPASCPVGSVGLSPAVKKSKHANH